MSIQSNSRMWGDAVNGGTAVVTSGSPIPSLITAAGTLLGAYIGFQKAQWTGLLVGSLVGSAIAAPLALLAGTALVARHLLQSGAPSSTQPDEIDAGSETVNGWTIHYVQAAPGALDTFSRPIGGTFSAKLTAPGYPGTLTLSERGDLASAQRIGREYAQAHTKK